MSRHSLITLLVSALFIIPGAAMVYFHSLERGTGLISSSKRGDAIVLSAKFSSAQDTGESVSSKGFHFWLPERNPHFRVVEEQVNSGPFSLVIDSEAGRRQAILSAKTQANRNHDVSYQLVLKPRKFGARSWESLVQPKINLDASERAVLKEKFNEYCSLVDQDPREKLQNCLATFLRNLRKEHPEWLTKLYEGEELDSYSFAQSVAALLRDLGFQVQSALGVPLKGFQSSIKTRQVLFFHSKPSAPFVFDMRREKFESARSYLWWTQSSGIFKSVRGLQDFKLELSSAETRLGDQIPSDDVQSSLFRYFDLYRLPVSSQALFEFTLLLPLAALIVCLVRNLIGLSTFGTFMPALLGVSFIQTGIVAGIMLTLLVLALGTATRLAADRLYLLLVPRLTSVLTVVCLVFLLLTQVSFDLGWEPGLKVTLFPIIVLTMMVERFTIIVDEYGFAIATGRFLTTAFVSWLCFLVLSVQELQVFLFDFPEANLIVLGAAILLGRYTGYRLTELFRFRALVETK